MSHPPTESDVAAARALGAAGPERLVPWFVLATALGLAARVGLAAVSIGSYDVRLWHGFGEAIVRDGVAALYRANPQFNHPPIPGLWAAFVYAVAEGLVGSIRLFSFTFKLPVILAEVATCWLLWRAWLPRRGRTFAAGAAALYAWNPAALLISGHHCNTDPIYAMLALLCVYLIDARGAWLLAGIAIGLSINVKLIPVVLLPLVLLTASDRRALARLVAGLSLMTGPFVVAWLFTGSALFRNAIGYASAYDYWGLSHFLLELVRIPKFSGWAQPLLDRYHELGRYVMLLATVLWALAVRRRAVRAGQTSEPTLDRYSAAAVAAALFLILTPGFGMQYVVFVGPLLFACRLKIGVLYGLLSGAGLAFAYWNGWDGTFPIESASAGSYPAPAPLLGLLAWATLVVFVWQTIRAAWNEPAGTLGLPGSLIAARPTVVLAAILLAGTLAREVVAWFSFGSADVGIFHSFAQRIDEHGIAWLYRNEQGFNHPPLGGWWAWLAGQIAAWADAHFPARWPWFSFIFKQPMIAADAITSALLFLAVKHRSTMPRALGAAAIYAFSPLSILLSAHHGNTDPVYAMLCLLAAQVLATRGSFWLCGLALGAAINVKFIPVLLVPVFAALVPDWRALARYGGGLAVAGLGFVPMLLIEPAAMLRNVTGYTSTVDYWGLNQFLLETSRVPRFSAVAQALAQSFNERGRWIVLGATLLLILWMRRNRWTPADSYRAAFCAAASFLVLSPGFGLQYLALVAPLLVVICPVAGAVFGLTAGLFALFNYWLNWTGGLPVDSTGIAAPPRAPGAQFGLLAWAALAFALAGELRSRAAGPRRCSPQSGSAVH